MASIPTLDVESRQVLSACFDYWSREQLPEADRVICFAWVARVYRERFGLDLSRAKFDRLAALGLLEKADSSRGGRRRYYRVPEPAAIRAAIGAA
jgi:hypothetical protein